MLRECCDSYIYTILAIYDLKYVYSPCLTYQVHRHRLENRHCNGKVKVN